MGGPKSPRMHLLLELLHLAAWAQAGVVVRIYLGKLFGAACDPQVSAVLHAWIDAYVQPHVLDRPK